MNILTFDIEDWYCFDNISRDMEWSKFTPRIAENTSRILDELERRNLRGTFFCLGWLAKYHPDVIRNIANRGHQIGCHSYQHELATRFDKQSFYIDTHRAISEIEHVIGKKVELFRAPAFSVTRKNLFVFEVLHELGITTDCSIFPALREYGGMPDCSATSPVMIDYQGIQMKEFPLNIYKIGGRSLVFSGGGYFRIFPYVIIKHLTQRSEYVMTYFHPIDFDSNPPPMPQLPKLRQWKNTVGHKSSFIKFQSYLNDFDFISIEQADDLMNWKSCKTIYL
jgi:polysaccharide deacetylase family protein (PEP-CTERM system associated)